MRYLPTFTMHFRGIQRLEYHLLHLDERQYVTFSFKGLKTITNNQYEPACGILSLLDIFGLFTACNSSCGMVMFSQMCVIPSVHKEGVPLGPGGVYLGLGVYISLDTPPEHTPGHTHCWMHTL